MAGEKLVDTSVVVRYLTGDPPEMAEHAKAILDRSADLVVTDVALAETAFVLTSVYRIPRERVVDSLVQLVQKPNLTIFGLDKDVVTNALLLCRPSGRISFSDALIWAAARSANVTTVFTFDERFPSDGLDLRVAP